MRASCWTRLCPAPAVSRRASLKASTRFVRGGSLASLMSEMVVVAVVMQFAQTLEVQRVTILIMEWQETSLVTRIGPTLSKN
jgi:predicted regulator of amino acid metabolism with ACT domain